MLEYWFTYAMAYARAAGDAVWFVPAKHSKCAATADTENEKVWVDAAMLAKALRDHIIDIPGVLVENEFVTVPIKFGMPFMLRIKVMTNVAPAITWSVILANGPETPTKIDSVEQIKTYNNDTGSFFWKVADHVAEKRTVDKIIAERARLANILITAPNVLRAMAAPVPA